MSPYAKVIVAASLFVLTASASSTMIVVVYTKDGLWIAADGYRHGSDKHLEDVCKIHQTRFGLVAKAGESQGIRQSGDHYSTDKEIEGLLVTAPSLLAFQSSSRAQFKDDIEEELAVLVDDPQVSKANLKQSPMGTPIPESLIPIMSRLLITVDTQGTTALARVLNVVPQSDPAQIGLRTLYRYWAPSTLGWHEVDDRYLAPASREERFEIPASMRQFASATSYQKTDEWVRQNPEKAIREVLEKGHREHPTTIGPPYTIAHVINREGKAPLISWVSKGACPGWTERVYKEDTLLALRDELRRNKAVTKGPQVRLTSPKWQSPFLAPTSSPPSLGTSTPKPPS